MKEFEKDQALIKRISEEVLAETGVELDQLINPSKVVNLERDIINLTTKLETETDLTERQKIEDKITEIYLWHTNGRKSMKADAEKLLVDSVDLLYTNSGVYRSKFYKNFRKMNDKIEKQDQTYMKEIIGLADYLWT
jgi:hypothetical protein